MSAAAVAPQTDPSAASRMTQAPRLTGRVDAVVIGASAGGVEALLQLLPALPRDVVTPIVVVVHLPRDRPSLLSGVFAARCAMTVREAEDKMPVEPGTIYFAPPDYHLLLDRGPGLALSADAAINFSRPSIDALFESAVDVYRERLAAIILTGANHDGAAGLDAVHRGGGIAIVQTPETASAREMPAAALRRVGTAIVTTLAGIGAILTTLDTTGNEGSW